MNDLGILERATFTPAAGLARSSALRSWERVIDSLPIAVYVCEHRTRGKWETTDLRAIMDGVLTATKALVSTAPWTFRWPPEAAW